MPLYAGVCETNITPPPDVWMSGYGARIGPAIGVHDELYARALVADDGGTRVVLVVADVIAFSPDLVTRLRAKIAEAVAVAPSAILLHATHTHGGPYLGIYNRMGERDDAYTDVFCRKIVGAAAQAANRMQPAHFTYGESAGQIGVNRREARPEGKTVIGRNYAGPVDATVQSLCVNSADGRVMALMFCHACHATTLGGNNRMITADWPGAAVAHLKARALRESADSGLDGETVFVAMQGCAGDVNPLWQGDWEAMWRNGQSIGDAAHAARWNAHGRQSETISAEEMTLSLPVLAETQQTMNFAMQRVTLGGVSILALPAEPFVSYQIKLRAAYSTPLMTLGYTNGCWNYLPIASEYARGGYEVDEAHHWYGNPMFAPESEALVLAVAEKLMEGSA